MESYWLLDGGVLLTLENAIELSLLALLTIAAVGAAILLGLAVAAFARRQSRPYLLIALAIAALLGRSAVAGLALYGSVSHDTHHFLEHALDVVMVGLVIGAVYYARTVTKDADYHS